MISLLWGNCFDFKGLKADIIISDMPYGTTNCAWDSPIDLNQFWKFCNEVCGGSAVLFAQTPFDKMLGASNIENLRYEWIWEKRKATGHLNVTKCPLKAHENILVFGKTKYFPQKSTGHERLIKSGKKVDETSVYGKQNFDELKYDSTERFPRSVINSFPDAELITKYKHPTRKPQELMEYLVRTYTQPGDTVLDPFMGSGTTGVACKLLDRKFIGIEKEQEYFEMATQRLDEIGSLSDLIKG